jgi:hypothetical protein
MHRADATGRHRIIVGSPAYRPFLNDTAAFDRRSTSKSPASADLAHIRDLSLTTVLCR